MHSQLGGPCHQTRGDPVDEADEVQIRHSVCSNIETQGNHLDCNNAVAPSIRAKESKTN